MQQTQPVLYLFSLEHLKMFSGNSDSIYDLNELSLFHLKEVRNVIFRAICISDKLYEINDTQLSQEQHVLN